MEEESKKQEVSPVAQCILNYVNEAETARRKREALNEKNFSCYHLEGNWDHKREGQSKEFLPRQAMAVEQIVSFLQRGLIDKKQFFDIEREPGVTPTEEAITPEEIQKLLRRQLDKNNYVTHVSDELKSGLLGSLMICKVGVRPVVKKSYSVGQSILTSLFGRKVLKKRERVYWQLSIDLVRFQDFYPDPTGRGLYRGQKIEMDYHELKRLAEKNPKQWDMSVINQLGTSRDVMNEADKANETGQNVSLGQSRKVVVFYEFWGTFVDPVTGEVLHENSVARTTLDGFLIGPPTPNPLWHEEDPYVVTPIIRVPHSVFHKALMDAATYLNVAQNELFNLILDGGLNAVHGIKQIRMHWLADPSQVANGIYAGMTLKANNKCPPGEKVIDRVDTGNIGTTEGIEAYRILDREFQQSSMTNDTRLGNIPDRAVKSTEIVAANQAINGVFSGIVTNIEVSHISETLKKGWMTVIQHMDDFDDNEVKALIGEERARQLAALSPEERFASSAQGNKFKVFGLSNVVNKIQDFRKYTTLLQTIGGSPELKAEFDRRYSMSKMLGEMIDSLDINVDKIMLTKQEMAIREQERQAAAKVVADAAEQGVEPEERPDTMSQVPSAANMSRSSDIAPPRAALNQGGLTTPQASG